MDVLSNSADQMGPAGMVC